MEPKRHSERWGGARALEIVYYTIAAVVLYLAADRIVDAAERMAGRRFEQRSIYFFVLLSVMAVGSFYVIRQLTT